MRIRLEPADEYLHSLEEASNFNEIGRAHV